MRKSPDWRCNTIRTTRHPLEWTSPILIHGFESFQNQACETLSFSETKMKHKSTRKVHLPNITQSSGGFPTTRFPNNQSLQPTSPTKLIDCDSWPPRPPRIFVPLLWWPVIQMSSLFIGGISASCFWGHMGWKHREYWRLTGSKHVLGEPNWRMPYFASFTTLAVNNKLFEILGTAYRLMTTALYHWYHVSMSII